ncbi:hypothetical protein [Deinococcus aluminii]
MPYTTLSEQMKYLSNPQRSDAFVKRFREAVRTGEIEAAQLPQRFTLPKTFRKRGSNETGTREVREMIFELTPEYETWFNQVNEELAAPTRSAKIKPSVEAIASGQLDFKALAEETRRQMQARFEHGQKLGQSRTQARAKPTRRGRATKAKK